MIGILILNYKKYQVTADCIRSVLDTGDGLDYHIYVLDNGSGNDSIACLQAQFPNNPRITWMESAENTGYARGNNQMLSRARKDGCTAAVITNSDIVFLPDTLQQRQAAPLHLPGIPVDGNLFAQSGAQGQIAGAASPARCPGRGLLALRRGLCRRHSSLSPAG